MGFNYIVFTGCLIVICQGQDNLEEVNSLLRQELQIQKKACEGVAKMATLLKKVTEFSENETIILEEQLLSAKISICEVYKKTNFLVGKVDSLKESQMSNRCFKQHQCNDIIPAINSIEKHLEERKEKHNAAILILSMLNESLPECSQDKILREVNFFLKRFNTISTKIIVGYIPTFESEVKKYFLPFLLWITIAMLISLYSFRRIVVLLTASVILLFAFLFFNSCAVEHMELTATFQDDVLPFDLNETQTLEVLNDIFRDVRTKRKFEDFKVILRNNFKHGKENAKRIEEDLNHVMKSFAEQSLAENLKDRGYSDLANEARSLHKDFRRYLEELIKTLKFSQDFYNHAVDSFEAILESNSEIETWQILLFLKNILTKSKHLQEDFSTHKFHFQVLIKELNHLIPQIRKHQQSNDNINLGVKMFATAFTFGASFLYPPLLLALVPIGGGVMYVDKQAKENNVALQDLNEYRVKMKDYSKETVEQLSNIDPMKITESIETLERVKGRLSHDALEYYFKDALDMASENLNEVNDIIRKLKELYRSE